MGRNARRLTQYPRLGLPSWCISGIRAPDARLVQLTSGYSGQLRQSATEPAFLDRFVADKRA
ncbi:hypothetical protein E2C01_010931 [Portunus trituberculatus]|uniref:Uncharacterized protein n=1 Tax=Portunus trituberculatus TaxID=210409 RepID=A0A5B7D9N9_PORTR|nr:hypothetical protein [Portunus trituberculatus]